MTRQKITELTKQAKDSDSNPVQKISTKSSLHAQEDSAKLDNEKTMLGEIFNFNPILKTISKLSSSEIEDSADQSQNDNSSALVLGLVKKEDNSVFSKNTLHLSATAKGIQYQTLDSDNKEITGFISNEILGYEINEKTNIESFINDLANPENSPIFLNIFDFINIQGHFHRYEDCPSLRSKVSDEIEEKRVVETSNKNQITEIKQFFESKLTDTPPEYPPPLPPELNYVLQPLPISAAAGINGIPSFSPSGSTSELIAKFETDANDSRKTTLRTDEQTLVEELKVEITEVEGQQANQVKVENSEKIQVSNQQLEVKKALPRTPEAKVKASEVYVAVNTKETEISTELAVMSKLFPDVIVRSKQAAVEVKKVHDVSVPNKKSKYSQEILQFHQFHSVLQNYWKERKEADDYYTFFCVSVGHFSKTNKLDAINALLAALQGEDSTGLHRHKATLENGKLGKEINAYLKTTDTTAFLKKNVSTISELLACLEPQAQTHHLSC
ncbi:MAG: hypothetical protein H0U70_06280 [Tatlockia sp.]|nr:hypothetical protein [Tatlockia sp.]